MEKHLLFITLVLFSIGMNAQNSSSIHDDEGKVILEERIISPAQNDLIQMTKGPFLGDLEYLRPKTIRALNFEENNIIGTVQNEAGERLIGAHVLLYNGDRFVEGTVSSEYGLYELIFKNNATEIEISHLGYQPIRESVAYFLDNPMVVLKEGIDLETVVVTAESNNAFGGSVCWGMVGSPINLVIKDSIAINLELNINFHSTKWQVYPNPAIDRITVKTVFSEGVFKLLAANGQVLKLIPIQELQTEINLDGYPAGSYYLRYESKMWVETFGPVVKVGM